MTTTRIEWRHDEQAARASRAAGLVESAEVFPFLIVVTTAGVEHAIRLSHAQALAFVAEEQGR
jgi:hypothetical protein